MEKKSNKGLICLVVILFLAVLGLGGYILYDKDMFHLKKNDVTESTKTKETEVDYDLDKADELLGKYGLSGKDKQKISWIKAYQKGYPDDYKRWIVLDSIDTSGLDKIYCSDWYSDDQNDSNRCRTDVGVIDKTEEVPVIPYDKANEVYKNMYGEMMAKRSFSISDGFFAAYSYNQYHNSFIKSECGGCGGTRGPQTRVFKIKNAKISGNKLTVQVYAQVTNADYAYGNDAEKITYRLGDIVLEAKTEEDATKEVIEKYLDKVDLYEVKFEKNKEDYMLKSLVKLVM